MKKYWIVSLIAALCMLLVPTAVNSGSLKKDGTEKATEMSETEPQDNLSGDESISVFLADEGIKKEFSMRDYIIGAVAAEMPAAYELEALKAQAAASVTLARYMAKQNENSDENDGAVISTDSKKHQGYMSVEEMRERWGDGFEKYYGKLCEAVDAVLGCTVTYNGEIALTAFHAISSGKTESAENVWGKNIPYLTAVDSEGDSLSAGYLSQVQISKEELTAAFPQTAGNSGDGSRVSDASYTASGTLKSVVIDGVNVTGDELRAAFSLRSSNITVREADNGGISLEIKGYGHGVGMSQYGADYYARQGLTWQEIIEHYYPGTELKS